MTHVLIAGMTESGKTTLAKDLCHRYYSRGYATAVLDPLNDPDWCPDFQTRDSGDFLECARNSRSLGLFLDESGESVGKYNDEMFWLATRARHYGHKSHFLTQRPQQLSRTVWNQCSHLFLFNISAYDAKLLADEFNKPELRRANELAQFECFYAPRFGPVKRLRIDPARTAAHAARLRARRAQNAQDLDNGDDHVSTTVDPGRGGADADRRGPEATPNGD
jgi:DNA helicase HerA-like ATPase